MGTHKFDLSGVTFDEVSLVGSGDNPEAHIAIFKSREDSADPSGQVGQEMTDDEAIAKALASESESLVSKFLSFLKNDSADSLAKADFNSILWREAQQKLTVCLEKYIYALSDANMSTLYEEDGSSVGEAMKQNLTQFEDAVSKAIEQYQNMEPLEIAKINKSETLSDEQVEEITVIAADHALESIGVDRADLIDVEDLGQTEADQSGGDSDEGDEGESGGSDVAPEPDADSGDKEDDTDTSPFAESDVDDSGKESNVGDLTKEQFDALPEDVRKYITDMQGKVEKLQKDDSSGEDSMYKGMSPELIKKFKGQEATIAKMQKEREEAEFISKARDQFPDIGADPEELGKAMRRVAKGEATPEDAEYIEKCLAGASALVKTGAIFGEFGKRTSAESGGVEDQISKKAREIAVRDGISVEMAFGKVRQEAPELAEEYSNQFSE